MKNLRENISNIEDCLCKVKDQNNLIDLMINSYFDKSLQTKEDEFGLIIDYKFYQSLIFTISDVLKGVESTLQQSITNIYDEFRKNN